MNPSIALRPRSSTGFARRVRLLALASALLATIAARPAYAQLSDVFASNGGFAAEGSADWWENHNDEFRTVSECCLPWLQEAFARQQQALAYYDAARSATGDEARELNRLANEQIAVRTQLLSQFRDCVNDANHARAVANQGGDPTGLMPAGCGEPLSDLFNMDDGLGVETAAYWFLYEIPSSVRAKASCCEDLLDDAQDALDRALRQLSDSKASGLTTAQRDALVDKAQKSLRGRTRALTRFHACVKQAARSVGATLPPAALASTEAEPTNADDTKPRTCARFNLGADKYGADVEVDDEGGPPVEPGVDWEVWYKRWIDLVRLEVFAPVEKAFARDGNQYECTIDYTVFPDRRVVINGGNCTGSVGNGTNFGNPLRERLLLLNYPKLPNGTIVLDPTKSRVPPFPAGATQTPVRRIFTFRHNMGPKGIKLGGPPSQH